jgi:hypothetical protein
MPKLEVRIEAEKLVTKTGVMQKLLVYEHGGGALLGSGWVIHHNGKSFRPTLIAFDGTELPIGWYNIKILDETYLIVVNNTVQ